jgi:hypothetical protein
MLAKAAGKGLIKGLLD